MAFGRRTAIMSETKKQVTLTVRMTLDEKREADACACHLGLPLSTFFRFAARKVFNDNREQMINAGTWQPENLPDHETSNTNSEQSE
jgi:hypothetical protein